MESQEIKNLIKENRYVQAIFRYGIIPVTLLLQEYEEKEAFEECEIIYKAIYYMNKHLPLAEGETPLPTKYNKEALRDTLNEFQKYGYKGDIFKQNIPHYIEEIKKMITL